MKSSSLLKSTRLDVLGITEGKLTFSAKDEALEIVGYKLIRKDDGDDGGGCLLYFAEDLRLMENFFFSCNLDNIEAIWVDIIFHSQRFALSVCIEH